MHGHHAERLTPMITEKELINSIRECEADPTPYNMSRLAECYVIYDHLFGVPMQNEVGKVMLTRSDTEFLQAVNGKRSDGVWGVMDELMETLKLVNRRAYDGVMRKLNEL